MLICLKLKKSVIFSLLFFVLGGKVVVGDNKGNAVSSVENSLNLQGNLINVLHMLGKGQGNMGYRSHF